MSTVVEPAKRRALGKGLESLLPSRPVATQSPIPQRVEPAETGKPREIPVER